MGVDFCPPFILFIISILFMKLILLVKKFLLDHQLTNQPLLLGLSGGADSLCLFYTLLECGQPFQIAHVDHGWRPESKLEAFELEQLAARYQIPFHCKRLDPDLLQGNLEDACRRERYHFFAEICQQHQLKGVLLGHHGDDQAETVLKRVLEGAHWSHLHGLKSDTLLYGVRALRPFLSISKKEIRQWLEKREHAPFEDQTNHDPRFLRARMREKLIPYLNQEFGKDVQHPLQLLGEESEELSQYFDQKIEPFIKKTINGPLGTYLDLKEKPTSYLENKFLIRKVCENAGLHLSRSSIANMVEAIMNGVSNRLIRAGQREIWVDRGLIFIPNSFNTSDFETISITRGCTIIPNWIIEVKDDVKPDFVYSSWKEGWQGTFRAVLPKENYTLALPVSNASYQARKSTISKWWNHHKIPLFLRSAVPVIWLKGNIYHEFLTGRTWESKDKHESWIEVTLKYQEV